MGENRGQMTRQQEQKIIPKKKKKARSLLFVYPFYFIQSSDTTKQIVHFHFSFSLCSHNPITQGAASSMQFLFQAIQTTKTKEINGYDTKLQTICYKSMEAIIHMHTINIIAIQKPASMKCSIC